MKLKPSELVCDRCKGTGKVRDRLCRKCYGEGKLDWIDNIKGRTTKFDKIINSLIRKEAEIETKKIMLQIDDLYVEADELEDKFKSFKVVDPDSKKSS